MGIEYYYLFGLDISLDDYKLGTIKQPRLIDYINNKISIDSVYVPFIINDIIVNQINDKEGLIKIKQNLGSLTFMIMNCYQSQRLDVLLELKNSLFLLYGCEANINEDFTISVGEVVINDSNFDILCCVVLEMLRIDKSKLKLEKEEELDEITKRFEMLRKKHRDKVGKNTTETIDMLNYLIHSKECGMDYNKVLHMTMYQVRNTIETIGVKDNYETTIQYKLSQKFDVKEDIKHWSTKKIIKNSSIK